MSDQSLIAANARRWQAMQIRPSLIPSLDRVARRLVAPSAKTRYQEVAAATRVPWFIIAVIHEREASQSWAANIAQGDPWNAVSRHVPKGRGPFSSWKDAALDALINCAPYAARWNNWTAGGALTLLEHYNGLGYANRGMPSPYIWASSDQYSKGKYVADGVFDPDAVDRQLGCAALIARMAALDSSIAFADRPAVPTPKPTPVPKPVPKPRPVPAPAPTIFALLVAALAGVAHWFQTHPALIVGGIVIAAVIGFLIFRRRKS